MHNSVELRNFRFAVHSKTVRNAKHAHKIAYTRSSWGWVEVLGVWVGCVGWVHDQPRRLISFLKSELIGIRLITVTVNVKTQSHTLLTVN